MKSSKGSTYFLLQVLSSGVCWRYNRNKKARKYSKTSGKGMEKQRETTTVLQESLNTKQSVKESEIRLISFVLGHNIPFNVANHPPNLLRTVCPDSKIAKQITLGRYKCTDILKNVIGKNISQKNCSHHENQTVFSYCG